MYIIPEFNFCFLAAPRTGSKAIAQALLSRGAIVVGSHHTTPEDHDIKITPEWTVCSAVRNHWDALISWWFKIERRGKMAPLAKFIPRFILNNPNFVQDGQLYWKTLPHTNTLLRYEWLQADFDYALVKAGMAPLELPRVIDSKREGRPYQAFYKSGQVKLVEDYFKAEIKRLGYKF